MWASRKENLRTLITNERDFLSPLEFKRAVTIATLEEKGHLDAADDVGAF